MMTYEERALMGAARAPGTKVFPFQPEAVTYKLLKNPNKEKIMGLSGEINIVNSGKQVQECKRDYQKEAAQVKRLIDLNSNLLQALSDYSSSPGASHDVVNDTFTLNELFGYLSLSNIKLVKAFDMLLKEAEKEKADGSK